MHSDTTRRVLPLAAAHAARGAVFARVWDLELPERFSPAADAGASEHRACVEAAGLFDRSYRALVDIQGKGAAELLEHVVSSPVAALGAGAGQPSCLLSPKGRLLASFHLFRLDADVFRLAFLAPARPEAISSLRKYAVLSDIEVLDAAGRETSVSLVGPRSEASLRAALSSGEPAATPWALTAGVVAGTAVRMRRTLSDGVPGFELWADWSGDAGRLASLWLRLEEALAAQGGGAAGWQASESLRLEAGLPLEGVDIDVDRFPGEVGWDGALTYDKCYVGQEVVARTRTYGHVNQKLVVVARRDAGALAPSDRVFAGGEEAGVVLSAAYSYIHGRAAGMALLKRKHWQAPSLRLEDGADLDVLRAAGAAGA